MLTPQEVSEHAFAKASFGGYNMAMVDEFLDALTADYTALYKENAVLKSKMKVLVDKVEEYRSTEDAMRKALLTAQKLADEMVQEAERKKTDMLAEAELEAQKKLGGLRQEFELENARLAAARETTAAYVAKVRDCCARELDYIDHLAELTATAADPVVTAAQEIETSMNRMMVSQLEDEAAPEDLADTIGLDASAVRAQTTPEEDERPGGLYQDLAAFAVRSKSGMEEQHLEVTLGQPRPAAETPPVQSAEPARRIDFDHLQFGKDYEIK